MHDNSILLFEKYALPGFTREKSVLEIGPDHLPSTYEKIVGDAASSWDYLDIFDRPGLTHLAKNEYLFPIPDDSYDIVVSGNVLEHVRKIWVWIKELSRVCRPGGVVITVNPVSWPFHEAPVDCWRAYPDGMKALYEDADLEVRESVFDSLEDPGFKRYLPGRSRLDQLEQTGWKGRLVMPFLRRLGVPVERAYDTITIGEKKSKHP
jgi:SAM-dependent methyltransferase